MTTMKKFIQTVKFGIILSKIIKILPNNNNLNLFSFKNFLHT